MRLLFALLLTAGCDDVVQIPDAAGSACDPSIANTCGPGLVCCTPCQGIPPDPDAGPVFGNCTSDCPQQLCP
jgi:hypothetical protein